MKKKKASISLEIKAFFNCFFFQRAVRTGLTEFLITTEIQPVIKIFQEKHPVLHLLHFYIFPIGVYLVPTG